jgi:hypothetical protein
VSGGGWIGEPSHILYLKHLTIGLNNLTFFIYIMLYLLFSLSFLFLLSYMYSGDNLRDDYGRSLLSIEADILFHLALSIDR